MKGVNSRYCFKNMQERLVDKHLEGIRELHPEAFGSTEGVEEGEVLPREVVVQSSRNPVKIKPPLEATSIQLYRHRADTHTRIAHSTSDVIAKATGVLDGLVDGLANGAAELLEDGAFFVSKTYHGVRHGWVRGKYQSGQDLNLR